MRNKVNKEQILEALDTVQTPGSEDGLVTSGMIGSVVIRPNNNVGFAIEINPEKISSSDAEDLRKSCEATVSEISGVEGVTAVLTAESQKKLEEPEDNPLGKVKNIIVVGSGKGGVGKSTISVNLAISLGKLGYKTGLVDADILGPSLTRMMGVKDKPESNNGQIIPQENHGIKFVSIGLLIDEAAPIVWRGPMIAKALSQLMQSKWDELDYLIIDLPPGTGDVQITLSKYFDISGAVIVSTPQKVALMDVQKAIGMFNKMDIPVYGVVENMSYFQTPGQEEKNYIFGTGNTEEICEEYDLDLISSIPLLPAIAEKSDSGSALSDDESKKFLELAKEVTKRIDQAN